MIERSKAQEHPIERQISPLAYEIDQGNGNGEVGESDQGIRNHMEPDQPGFHNSSSRGHEIAGRKKAIENFSWYFSTHNLFVARTGQTKIL